MSLDGIEFKSVTPEGQIRMFHIDDFDFSYAQEQSEVAGCTDDDALNFNIEATMMMVLVKKTLLVFLLVCRSSRILKKMSF